MSIVEKQKEIKNRSAILKNLDRSIKEIRSNLRFSRETLANASTILATLKKRYNNSNKEGNFSDVSFCAKEINFYRSVVTSAQGAITDCREELRQEFRERKAVYERLVEADKELTAMMAEA